MTPPPLRRPAPQPPLSWALLPLGLPQQRATGLPEKQPRQSEPLVPLSVGSRSSENGKQQTRWENVGSPPSRLVPDEAVSKGLIFPEDPAHSAPPSHPSGRSRRLRRSQLPCARTRSAALPRALSSCRAGQRLAPPGHSLCQRPSSAF